MTKRDDVGRRRRGQGKAPTPLPGIVRDGITNWVRDRMLPRLVPLTPPEIADLSPEGRRRTLSALMRALRSERARGRAGHWTYSLDRHIGLLQAVAAERAGLIGLGATPAGSRKTSGAERGGPSRRGVADSIAERRRDASRDPTREA